MDGSLGYPERPWERPWERWTPRGNVSYSASASRQSELTLEVSMRDIIMNSKESMSLHPRWSGESTRTEALESSSEKNVGGEKGKPPAPPAPVGFWDHRLKKTRVDVVKAWMKTSRCINEDVLWVADSASLDPFGFHSWGSVDVLGCPVPRQ